MSENDSARIDSVSGTAGAAGAAGPAPPGGGAGGAGGTGAGSSFDDTVPLDATAMLVVSSPPATRVDPVLSIWSALPVSVTPAV